MRLIAIPLFASLLLIAAPAIAQKETAPPQPKEPTSDSQSPRKSPPVSGFVAVGDLAPTFELDAADGRAIPLKSLRGGWIVLVFSDRWQPLRPLQQIESQMREMDARVVGVCHEKAHTISGVARREKLTMFMLADVTGQVSSMYGLYDHEHSETQQGFLILDPHGVVQLDLHGSLPPPDVIARLTEFVITGH